MIIKLCKLVGHQRDKKRIRPFFEGGWRTNCVRCGIDLMRDAGRTWEPLVKHDDIPPKTYHGSRIPDLSRVEGSRSSSMTVVLKPDEADECFAPDSGAPRADPITRTDEAQQTINFYLERADDCRRRAIVSADRSIELIHLDMATRYEMLAREARE